MKKIKKFPFVSIITVSRNAEHLLGRLLESTRGLNYPKNRYEVIVVDNGSTDGSVDFVKENFPEVKILKAGENLGFGKGNNFGMKHSKGQLYYLVNNDTYLTKDSLIESVRCFLKHSQKNKVGAINSKLVFIDSYLHIDIKGAIFVDYMHLLPENARPINKHPFVISYFFGSDRYEEVYIPINYFTKRSFNITIEVRRERGNSCQILMDGKIIQDVRFSKKTRSKRITLSFSKQEFEKVRVNLIQNAGNFFFKDGYSRDRGALIIRNRQYYECDNGQYDKSGEISGFCGAAVLLSKKVLDKVGYFDEAFFFYYEDGDLSLRMKKRGYKIYFCHKSLVRHIHAASSREWSPFFVFNSEKNRLLMVAKHWPVDIALIEWLRYMFRDTLTIPIYQILFKDSKDGKRKLSIRLRVSISLFFPFLFNLFFSKKLSRSEINNFY